MTRKELELLFNLSAKQNSNFSSTFKAAQSALVETQNRIQQLNKVQSDITAYQKQQQAVDSTKQRLAVLQQQYDNIQKEIQETEGYSSALENKLISKQAQIDKTTTSLHTYEQRLAATGNTLREAGVDTTQLTAETTRLETEVDKLKDQQVDLKKTMDEAGDGAKGFGEKSVEALDAVESVLATAGIAKALGEIKDAYMDCINIAGDFEASMSNVEALSGASGDELESLSDKAKEMGATTKFTAGESADALSYMALAGWNTQSMLEGISPVLNLAAAANMDLAQASDIVTDYLTAFGLKASDTTHFVDVMAYAMAHSNTDVIQLGEAYKACASTATSLGYSVEETTAVLATMANAGVKGGEAGTALNAIFTRLATNTKKCGDELANYGVNIYDAQGNMQSLSSILTGIAGVWGDLTDQEQANLAKTIAGTNQYSKLQTIMAGCSEAAAEGGQERFAVVHAVGDDVHRHAQHAAVRRNQRQIHAECLVKRRNVALEDNFNQLHERRDDQNEDHRLHIGEVDLARQQQMIDRPRDRRCQNLDEDNGNGHAGRLIELLGDAEERADAEELDEHVVVGNRRRQNHKKYRFHSALASFPLQEPALPQPGHAAQPNSFLVIALPWVILLTSAIMQPNTKKPPGAMVRMPMGLS